jgi:hypothetical protein
MLTNIDDAGLVEIAAHRPERESVNFDLDGVRHAQGRMLDEWPGAVFGLITLWYVVSSLLRLA